MRAKQVTLAAAVFVLVLAGVLPVLMMVGRSFVAGGEFGFSNYTSLYTPGLLVLMKNSSLLAAAVTLSCVVVGVPLGVLLERTDLPLRRWFALLLTVPLALPPYVLAVSWFHVLGRSGYVTQMFGGSLGEYTSSILFGLAGCVLVLTSAFLPIVMLLTMVFLRTVNPRLEEAGLLVAPWPAVLRSVTLPLIRPGLVLASTLIFLLALGEFGVPTFFRYPVFPIESFTQFSAFFDFGAATAAAMPLLLLTSVLLFVELSLIGEKTYAPLRAGTHDALTFRLGRSRLWLCAAVGGFCAVLVMLPLIALLAQSLTSGAYAEAATRGAASMRRSVLYACVGASLLTVLGFLLGYLVHRRVLRFWRAVDMLAVFLFALPGTVIGIGLVALWNRPLTGWLYASPAIILLGYLAQFAALSTRIAVAGLGQIPASMEEAAQVAGAGWFRRLALIVTPLSSRTLTAAWLAAYIFCLRDLGVSLIVYPPGSDTLPVRTFTLMANGAPELIAALCMLMVGITIGPLLIVPLVLRSNRAHFTG